MKIFIVDDHKIVRDGLKAMLLGHPVFKWCGSAGNAEECFAAIDSAMPDICIVDIQLPGKNGLEIAEELLEKYPSLKIMVATAIHDETVVRKCREIGVKAMISKESGMETYLEALDAVRFDKTFYAGQFTDLLIKASQGKSDKMAALTDREIEFIKVFSRGFSHKEIADKLNISPRTVEVHKKNVMEKLGIDNTVELIKFAIKEGLVELL